MPPRVAYLGSQLSLAGSGVERAIREQFLALAARHPSSLRLYARRSDVPPEMPSGVRFHAIPEWTRNRGLRILWEQLVFPAMLRRDPPDRLHAPAYVAPLLTRVPVMLNVYDLHVFTHPETCTRPNRLHYRAVLPRSIRKAWQILVPSARVRDTLLRLFPESETPAESRVTVVPLGVSPRFLAPADSGFQRRAASLRTRHALPERFLLFVGNAVPRKNLASLLRAPLPLPLVLAGKGTDACEAGNGALRVVRLGRVSDADLADLYRMAFALVHPALDEGFGLTVLEAMASGCPVVASPGIASELLPGVAAAADSPQGFAGAVRRLLDSPETREAAIRRGVAHAREFTWERVADAVARLAAKPPALR
jgi:glycosyltransferase involved in cell wall biosynthesis